MSTRRPGPQLRWRAVLAGLAVAVILALLARSFLAPVPGIAATIIGIALGGFVAGKWADSAGLYHGAVVGAGWIALEALGAVPTASYSSDVLTDTAIVFGIDALILIAGAIGGWRARPEPSSSSGRGRGR
jgi:hypothetical protein